MDRSIAAVLIAGQRVERARVDLVAHNLANVATDGFRALSPTVSEHVAAGGGPSVSMARLAAAGIDPTAGERRITGAPLDLAIEGEGWFQLETLAGERVLTRAGAFTFDAEGRVVAPDGARLLDDGGAPIALDTAGGAVTIAPDGEIAVGGRVAGRVGVFDTGGVLERRAHARFAPDGAVAPIDAPRVRQGALEASSVDAVGEMATMIEASRRYEALQSLVERDDRRVRNFVESFSRQT